MHVKLSSEFGIETLRRYVIHFDLPKSLEGMGSVGS